MLTRRARRTRRGRPRKLQEWLRLHPGGMSATSPGCRTRGSGRKKSVNPGGVAAGPPCSIQNGHFSKAGTENPKEHESPSPCFAASREPSPIRPRLTIPSETRAKPRRPWSHLPLPASRLRAVACEFQLSSTQRGLTPASLKTPRRKGGQQTTRVPRRASRLRAFACEFRPTSTASAWLRSHLPPLRLCVLV
jgi:hypothetical protein